MIGKRHRSRVIFVGPILAYKHNHASFDIWEEKEPRFQGLFSGNEVLGPLVQPAKRIQ